RCWSGRNRIRFGFRLPGIKYESALNQQSPRTATLRLGERTRLACTFRRPRRNTSEAPSLMKYNMREKNCAQKTPLTKSRESRALPGNFASQPFTFQCFMIHMKRLLILHVFRRLHRYDGAGRDEF